MTDAGHHDGGGGGGPLEDARPDAHTLPCCVLFSKKKKTFLAP